jgi:hypothetical protein
MEMDTYKMRLATHLGSWIQKKDNALFVDACRKAATEYLGTRTGLKKRHEHAQQLSNVVNTENAYELFIRTTSEDCWVGAHHTGFFFGCASLNTLLMEQVIIHCNQDTWQELHESRISEHYGEYILMCKKTDALMQSRELQTHCHDIYKRMDPLKLSSARRADNTSSSPAPGT